MSNYKDLKNYMHNDLKITREEIQDFVRDTIREEVKTIVDQKKQFIEQSIQSYIEYLVRQGLSDGGRLSTGFKERVSDLLSDAIGAFIANKIDIKLGVEGQEVELAKGDKHGFKVIGRNSISFQKDDDL